MCQYFFSGVFTGQSVLKKKRARPFPGLARLSFFVPILNYSIRTKSVPVRPKFSG